MTENVRKISKTLLPLMNIRKVFVEQTSITVNGILTSQDTGATPFWMDEQYFTEFIDVYFIIDHLSEPNRSRLADPNSRVSNYANYTNSNLESWDSSLKRDYNNKIISLKELTDLEADLLVAESSIQSSDPASAGSFKDIAFSIEIDIDKFDITGEALRDIKIHAFTHLNFNRLAENFNLDTSQASYIRLQQIGGNLLSETILITSTNESGDRVYRVPTTTSMLVYDDGTPFHGSYHYHGPNNPGPGDYIGWMEGALTPMHPDARLLREVQIPYSKVVANFLFDDAGFRGIGFDGSVEPAYPEVRQEFIYDTEAINRRALDEFYRTDRRSEALRGQPIIYNAQHDIGMDDSTSTVFSSTIFSIDFEEIIKTRSRYPFFYERFKTWYNISERDLQRASIIRSFKITRYRLSNDPRSNNEVGSPLHQRNSPEDIEETVMFSSQPPNNDYIFPSAPEEFSYQISESVSNHISRMSPPGASESWYQRTYELKDKDLAKNNFGKYAYNISIQIDDFIKSVFAQKVEEFRNYVENIFPTFLSLASMGIKEFDEDTGQSLGYIDGYDFNQRKYTDNFKTYSQLNFNSDLLGMIESFINLQGLLGIFGPEPNESSLSARINLVTQIIPDRNGDLFAALNFAKNCDHLLSVLEKILAKDSTFTTVADSDVNSTVLGQKHSSDKNIKTIDFSARIPGYNTAFNVGEVVVEYDLESLTEQAGIISAEASRFSHITDADSTELLADIREWVKLDLEVLNRYRANLENIIRTPPELTQGQAPGCTGGIPDFIPTFEIPGLSVNIDGPGLNTLPADINLNLGNFSSNDIKTPLGKIGNAAVFNSTKQISSNLQYKQNKENNEKAKANLFTSKIFSSLSNKLAQGASKKTKETGKDVIKSKAKKLLVQQGRSAEASYVPISASSVKKLGSPSSTVMVKVDNNVGSSEGSYRVSSVPKMMTISELNSLLSGMSQEQTEIETTQQTQSSNSSPVSSGLGLNISGGSY